MTERAIDESCFDLTRLRFLTCGAEISLTAYDEPAGPIFTVTTRDVDGQRVRHHSGHSMASAIAHAESHALQNRYARLAELQAEVARLRGTL